MQPELLRIGVDGVVPVAWDVAGKTDDGPGTLTGWASVYNVVDQQDEIVARGAFAKTLEHWRAGKRVVGLTLDHQNDAEGLIGKMIDAEDSAFGLKTTFQFSTTPKAQDARTKAREGILNGLSFFGPIFDRGFASIAGKSVSVLKEVGLWFVGLTPVPANAGSLVLAAKTVSDKPWSQFTQADYTPEQWRRACLIDTGQGKSDSKDRYALPIREPSGVINRNGVHAAAGRLNQVEASAEKKTAAARALVRIYRSDLGEDPPPNLLRMAGMASSALPETWLSDMRSALAIHSPVAQKAAVDTLVADMYGAAPAVGDATDDQPAEPADEPVEDDDAARYALSVIGESGPGESPPGGESGLPLADQLLASIDAANTRDELRAFAAELQPLRGES